MTGGDGRAFLSFSPKGKDILPIQVRTGSSPRVSSAEGEAHLVVWERRTPILMVELTALMEDVHAETPVSRLVPRIDPEARPIADAADELGKLTQFYYGVIYVVTVPAGADVFVTSVEARTWLSTHKFPRGSCWHSQGEKTRSEQKSMSSIRLAGSRPKRGSVVPKPLPRRSLSVGSRPLSYPSRPSGRCHGKARLPKTGKTCEKNCSSRPVPFLLAQSTIHLLPLVSALLYYKASFHSMRLSDS